MAEKQFVDLTGAQTLYNDLRPRAASADGNLAPHILTRHTLLAIM